MTLLLDQAADEIADANVTSLSKEVIREAISKLLWNWYYTNSALVLHTILVPIKFWKITHTLKYDLKVSDAKPLFLLIAGPEK